MSVHSYVPPAIGANWFSVYESHKKPLATHDKHRLEPLVMYLACCFQSAQEGHLSCCHAPSGFTKLLCALEDICVGKHEEIVPIEVDYSLFFLFTTRSEIMPYLPLQAALWQPSGMPRYHGYSLS